MEKQSSRYDLDDALRLVVGLGAGAGLTTLASTVRFVGLSTLEIPRAMNSHNGTRL